ncbi:putative N-acetylated-alpha-linked acidic dipeptidase [Branchiostoma floridae]|uniref:glutamate carboxypeptidase II n=1 Tax=Branchiostoma floridae TaxID=7739 RepID=A0A9J7L2Q6_BRAFL|nr:putative N-acetylated-alpha-linked acidic dipeptidase [Branchiostoma floridae]
MENAIPLVQAAAVRRMTTSERSYLADDDPMDDIELYDFRRRRHRGTVVWSKCRLISVSFVVLLFGVILGAILGYESRGELLGGPQQWGEDGDPSITQRIIDEVKTAEIDKHLRFLTARPHLAGSVRDEQVLVDYIYDKWQDYGLDVVKRVPYTVLLSYPNNTTDSYVSILTNTGDEVEKSAPREKAIIPQQNDSDVTRPFNAYSPSGEPQGDLVYGNYGTVEDFEYLQKNNIDCSGKIVILRYGLIFRGSKVENAEAAGAIGVILYSDPQDVDPSNLPAYPKGLWMPDTGLQRGTLFTGQGDPLTPGFPSTDTAYRLQKDDAKLPQIPTTPISWGDAVKYLRNLGGPEAPEGWSGGLNITYRLGPGFTGEYANGKMKMHVHNVFENRTITNVIGYINGSIESDRYVLLGNHRDAWVFGAIDPNSGTASLLELARVYGKLLQEGWRPRRTVVFCSWGAEEYGLVGSSEWTEDNIKTMGQRAVAYVNVDIAVQGQATPRIRSTPPLYQALYNATKQVPNPNPEEIKQGRPTVYDTWKYMKPDGMIGSIGSGSDYTVLLDRVGVPSVDMRYDYDRETYPISTYAMYHSAYETYDYVKEFIDPDFVYHRALVQIWGELARNMADSLLIPLGVEDYADFLQKTTYDFEQAAKAKLDEKNISLDGLKAAVQKFSLAAIHLEQQRHVIDRNNPFAVRKMNDKVMYLERAFIEPEGLPGRPLARHVVVAPSKHNIYASSSFPGLQDALFAVNHSADPDPAWETFKRQLSILTFTIDAAARTLVEDTE